MRSFQPPYCDSHPNSPSEYLALEQEIRRVCSLCPIHDNKYIVGNQQFQAIASSAFSELLQNEGRALLRHQELSEISVRLKGEYGRDDDEVLRRMMQVIEEESRAYKETGLRVQALKGQLRNVHSMITYFRSLRNGNLYEMKMNLSSEEGLRRFYKKCMDYAALIRRGVHAEFKKIEAELLAEEERLRQLDANSFLVRLKQCLVSRKMIANQQKTPNSPAREGKREQLKD
jgi:hypothetical protein